MDSISERVLKMGSIIDRMKTFPPYIGTFLTALLSLFVLYDGLITPENNWDVVPYIASSHALTENDAQQVHAWTFAELEQHPGTRAYAAPAAQADSAFRERMRTDPQAFSDILRFYQIRILYTFLILLLCTAGINAVTATHLIAALSVAGTLWVVQSIGRGRWSLLLQMAVPLLLLLMGGSAVSKLSTPDALALFVLMLILRSWLRGERALLVLLPLLVLVRTDLLLLTLCIDAALLHSSSSDRSRTFLSLLSSVLLSVLLHWHFRYPGWGTAFAYTFIDKTLLLAQHPVGFGTYLPVLTKGLTTLVTGKKFLLFCGLTYAALWQFRRSAAPDHGSMRSVPFLMIAAAAGYLIVRIFLFPMPELRFLVLPYTLVIVACAEAFVPRPAAFNGR